MTAPTSRIPSRIPSVIRMQLINKQTFVWVPLMIFGSSFVISMLIYGLIAANTSGQSEPMYGGGSQAPLWYFLVVGVQALSFTFPFSQALSITRREYFIGTYATAMITSATIGVTFGIGGLIERATDGWGFNAYFFYLPWIWDQGVIVAVLLYVTIAMLAFSIGFWFSVIYKRFATIGSVSAGVGVALTVIVAAFVITWTDSWPAVGRAIGGLDPIGAVIIALVLDAVLIGASYLTIRRAVP